MLLAPNRHYTAAMAIAQLWLSDRKKVKRNAVSFDPHTTFNCSEGLDQIGTISEKLMPMEKTVRDRGSETLFSITLNDTVYTERVQDGEELWSDRKFMCSPLSYF